MYVRVVRFTGVTAEHMASLVARVSDSGGPPPGVKTTGLSIAFDEAQGSAVVTQRFETKADMEEAAKIFDAMALAKPVVSTRVSMIPEILEGCGVVVEPGDVRALAGGLRRLLDDPAAAAELGRRARIRCEAQYSFRAARERLFPLFEGL